MNQIELSIVIPVYNEEGNLHELYKQLIVVLEKELNVTHELIFIDDGSIDNFDNSIKNGWNSWSIFIFSELSLWYLFNN